MRPGKYYNLPQHSKGFTTLNDGEEYFTCKEIEVFKVVY